MNLEFSNLAMPASEPLASSCICFPALGSQVCASVLSAFHLRRCQRTHWYLPACATHCAGWVISPVIRYRSFIPRYAVTVMGIGLETIKMRLDTYPGPWIWYSVPTLVLYGLRRSPYNSESPISLLLKSLLILLWKYPPSLPNLSFSIVPQNREHQPLVFINRHHLRWMSSVGSLKTLFVFGISLPFSME